MIQASFFPLANDDVTWGNWDKANLFLSKLLFITVPITIVQKSKWARLNCTCTVYTVQSMCTVHICTVGFIETHLIKIVKFSTYLLNSPDFSKYQTKSWSFFKIFICIFWKVAGVWQICAYFGVLEFLLNWFWKLYYIYLQFHWTHFDFWTTVPYRAWRWSAGKWGKPDIVISNCTNSPPPPQHSLTYNMKGRELSCSTCSVHQVFLFLQRHWSYVIWMASCLTHSFTYIKKWR